MHTKKLSSWIKAGLVVFMLFFGSLFYQPEQATTGDALTGNQPDKIVVAGGSSWNFDIVAPAPTTPSTK